MTKTEKLGKRMKSIIRSKCVSCGAVANLPTDDKDWRTDADVKFILEACKEEGLKFTPDEFVLGYSWIMLPKTKEKLNDELREQIEEIEEIDT